VQETVALILAEMECYYALSFVGIEINKANKVAKWVKEGCSKPCSVADFTINETIRNRQMIAVFLKR
jgi:hypothetical protein